MVFKNALLSDKISLSRLCLHFGCTLTVMRLVYMHSFQAKAAVIWKFLSDINICNPQMHAEVANILLSANTSSCMYKNIQQFANMYK